ncbi:activatory protein Cha4p [Diutina catenulata]
MKRKSSAKVLSCQRCRTRKVKCDYGFPCSQCVKAKVECVQTVDDMRKKRPAVNYVTTLQQQLAEAVDFITKLKRSDPTERSSMLNHYQAPSDSQPMSREESSVSIKQEPGADADDDESAVVYGPTSVFRDDTLKSSRNSPPIIEPASQQLGSLNKDADVLQCIKLFFTWQYPDHNMFIFREAFLIDFFNYDDSARPGKSRYCSQVLVLAVCALGSRMSDDDRIYAKSLSYYRQAKAILLDNLSRPSITSMQSFLLLAFYDICSGNNSSGWMMSGNAIRMGYDLGFQLNPEVWFVKNNDTALSPLDVSIRSRIYWGAYMADHFISLLLGRPSFLKSTDASIAETDDLPDLEWIDEYTYSGYLNSDGKDHGKYVRNRDLSYISSPLNNIINLINISDSMLTDVFTKPETHDDHEFDFESRLSKLSEYNRKIMAWKHSLPHDLQWDRAFLHKSAENPTLTYIRYYYYILLLCLNRPFLGIFLKGTPRSMTGPSPLDICNEAIEDLYVALRRFKDTHGLRRASIFMVYCSILSISIILLTNTSQQLAHRRGDRLQFFMEILRGASKTWKLAEKSYNLIKLKLQQRKEELDHQKEEKSAPPTPSQFGYYQPYSYKGQSPPPPLTPSALDTFIPGTSPGGIRPVISNLINPVVSSNINVLTQPFASDGPGSTSETSLNGIMGEDLDFLGGPPVLMTSDLFNEDWEQLFPDYVFNAK